MGRPKRQAKFRGKEKLDDVYYGFAELEAEPVFHGGCLRHPAVSARSEKFVQFVVERASSNPEN